MTLQNEVVHPGIRCLATKLSELAGKVNCYTEVILKYVLTSSQ